jgi:Protein of unknown function (DUF3040)
MASLPWRGSGRVRALSAITGTGDRSLEEHQKVEFDITHGQKGPRRRTSESLADISAGLMGDLHGHFDSHSRFRRWPPVRSSAGAPAYPGHSQAVSEADQSVPAGVPWEGAVPLSEHERRQLEQIEQALRASDPRLAGAAYATDPRVHFRRRVIGAALGFLSGVGLLFAGLVINVIPVAVAGFTVILACSLWAVTSYRRMTGITTGRVPARPRALPATGAWSRPAGR